MRHRKNFNHLGRKTGHRKAMLANMASSLILHKKVSTTTAKAKALRSFVEPLITKSKEDSTNSRRVVFRYLRSKEAVSELFREVSPKIADRPGGYTRILKTGTRLGDSADMCVIELVDYNENLLAAKGDSKEKSGKRRRRGGGKKSSEGAPKSAVAVEDAKVVEDVVEEKVEEVKEAKTETIVEETATETPEAKAEEEKSDDDTTEETKEN
jgi:large subunit ribosomal protein L17